MGFHKFDWMRAVAADTRIPGGEKFVLWYCAAIYVRYGEDTFCVRQQTIAARCAAGERTVRRAMARAQKLRYLMLAEPRQRGRGYHRANEYSLVVPTEIGDNLASVTQETEAKTDRNRGQNCQEYRPKPTPCLASTSENGTPKGLYKGLKEGYGACSAAPPARLIDDEEHPDTDAILTEAFPGLKAQRPQHWDTIANCDLCDEYGWRLGPDGGVADRAIRCRHEGDGR
jgi:hypothetical protein